MNQPKSGISEVAVLRALRALKVIDAETFCDRWHGLDRLSEQERHDAKAKWGYRAKCTRLLAAVLRKSERTVNNWGDRFEQMPKDYQVTLSYADVIRRQLNASGQLKGECGEEIWK